MKHKLSFLLPLLLLIVLIMPMRAKADSSGSCGDNVTWTLSGSTLTISGSGAMYDYSPSNHAPWWDYRSSIKDIFFNSGVTYVGDYAFADTYASNLYPTSSIRMIGCYAFANIRIVNLSLPSKLEYLAEGAFAGCTNLTSISFPSSLYAIGDYAFSGCTKLSSLSIYEGLGVIGTGAFSGCSSLTSVLLPSSLDCIEGHAFEGCPFNYSVTYAASQFEWISKVRVANGNSNLLNALSFYGSSPDWVLGTDDSWHLYDNGNLVHGWKQFEGKWYYLDENGSLVKNDIIEDKGTLYMLGYYGEWVTIPGVYFSEKLYNEGAFEPDCYVLVDQNGVVRMDEGWHSVQGEWFYVGNTGSVVMDRILYTDDGAYVFAGDGSWVSQPGFYDFGWSTDYFRGLYFIGSNGRLEAGWHSSNNSWYYMSKQEYSAYVGLWAVDGHLYYFDECGIMQTGEQTISNWEYDPAIGDYTQVYHIYTFGSDGAMILTSGWKKIGGRTYFVKGDGTLQTGWMQENGKWYYFDPSTYFLCEYDYAMYIDGEVYYFDDKGVMLTNAWRNCYWNDAEKNYYEGWCYFGSNGAAVKGWKQISGSWFYFDPHAVMLDGWQFIDNAWYYLGDDGAMKSGWQNIGGQWYYLNNSMVTGWKQVSGIWYYFGGNGVMRTGWQQLGSIWYYFGTDGGMKTGWKLIDGYWYYFASSGEMKTGWQNIDGSWYYLNYAMVTGWQQIDGTWYYFKSNGTMAKSETLNIGGTSYSFAANGAWIH